MALTRLPRSGTLIIAFVAVYFVWGSTYLAIRIAIETMPPLTMLGFRFGVAGVLMYTWLILRGARRPPLIQWGNAGLAGGLMLCGGTGAVTLGLQYVPSGLAALLITTVPLWMVMLNWLWKGGAKPSYLFFAGFGLGMTGVFLLVDPSAFMGTMEEGLFSICAILMGAICWSVGSLYGRDAEIPSDPFLSTALQMTLGGAALLISGMILGEKMTLSVDMFSTRSVLAWVYLLVFGSFVAFSAYIWLMRNTTPDRVSTYAYVNPVVAVYLGWAFANEPVTPRILIASVFLLSAVVIVIRFSQRSARRDNAAVSGISSQEEREGEKATAREHEREPGPVPVCRTENA